MQNLITGSHSNFRPNTSLNLLGGQEATLCYFPEVNSSTFSFSPAIKVSKNHFDVNFKVVFSRIALVAFPIIASIAFLYFSHLRSIYLLAGTVVICSMLSLLEGSRAVRALNKIAIEQFKKSAVTYSILVHVLRSKNLIDQVIENSFNLSVVEESGSSLWDILCEPVHPKRFPRHPIALEPRFANFKKLAEPLFDPKVSSNSLRIHYFFQALRSKNSEFIEYLLENKKVVLEDFTDEDQFYCWTWSDDSESAKVFHRYKLNPNVKDADGFTPLLRNAKNSSPNDYFYVKALLEAGADPRMTVEIEETDNKITVKKSKTALDFFQERKYRDAGIEKLLTDKLRELG